MRIAKWISPVMVGLALAVSTQAATAGLLALQPGACEPAQKVEPVPPACQPVRAYVPHVKACGPVQAVKACEPVRACAPVKTWAGSHEPFVLNRVANKVDRTLHAAAYKIHVWRHGGCASEYSPAPCAPVAPVSAAPASVPLPPVPSHS